jgi:hypothetical protein
MNQRIKSVGSVLNNSQSVDHFAYCFARSASVKQCIALLNRALLRNHTAAVLLYDIYKATGYSELLLEYTIGAVVLGSLLHICIYREYTLTYRNHA